VPLSFHRPFLVPPYLLIVSTQLVLWRSLFFPFFFLTIFLLFRRLQDPPSLCSCSSLRCLFFSASRGLTYLVPLFYFFCTTPPSIARSNFFRKDAFAYQRFTLPLWCPHREGYRRLFRQLVCPFFLAPFCLFPVTVRWWRRLLFLPWFSFGWTFRTTLQFSPSVVTSPFFFFCFDVLVMSK